MSNFIISAGGCPWLVGGLPGVPARKTFEDSVRFSELRALQMERESRQKYELNIGDGKRDAAPGIRWSSPTQPQAGASRFIPRGAEGTHTARATVVCKVTRAMNFRPGRGTSWATAVE